MDQAATTRILLIEDSTADAELVLLCLRENESLRYELVVATSLAGGIEQLGEHFDLVLLDLVLPDSTPEETLDRLRAAEPDLPVVILSGTRDDRLAKRCIQQGASAFLAKETLSPQGLGAVVRGAVSRSGRKL